MSENVLPMFSSRRFMVSCLIFKSFLKSIYRFIYFWPHPVLVAACGIFHCDARVLCCGTRASQASLQLWCGGSRVHGLCSCGVQAPEQVGSVVVACGLSSCGLRAQQLQCVGLVALWHVGSQFPDQRLNPHPLHWKVDS